jgi:two-component sensor histidine kinase
LELVVEDDGVGMVEVASTVENGLGKTLIARLARQVSGQFSITSVPGHGTRAVLRFRP